MFLENMHMSIFYISLCCNLHVSLGSIVCCDNIVLMIWLVWAENHLVKSVFQLTCDGHHKHGWSCPDVAVLNTFQWLWSLPAPNTTTICSTS